MSTEVQTPKTKEKKKKTPTATTSPVPKITTPKKKSTPANKKVSIEELLKCKL